jgi:sugar lactone lactonase YvrE
VVTLLDELVFPEGPRWHAGRLWFSDIHGNRVLAHQPGGETEIVAELGQPSGLGFLPDGSVLVATMRSKKIMRVHAGRADVHADLSPLPGDFLNDMIVDSGGRAYVGCRYHHVPGSNTRAGAAADCMVAVEPDGSYAIAANDLIGPNGTILTPDEATLIVAETHAFRLTAFDRAVDGTLSRRRLFAQLVPGSHPDGICLDAEGAVWVATGSSGEVLRMAEGGQILERRSLPDRWVTACVLGDEDRKTLFLTTAVITVRSLLALMEAQPEDYDVHRRWARSLSRGRVESLVVEVAGAGSP